MHFELIDLAHKKNFIYITKNFGCIYIYINTLKKCDFFLEIKKETDIEREIYILKNVKNTYRSQKKDSQN